MSSLIASTNAFEGRAVETMADIAKLLRDIHLGKHEYLILARGPEDYVQTTFGDNMFIVEGRDGSWETHKTAMRIASGTVSSAAPLTLKDAEAIFRAYFDERDLPPPLQWNVTPVEEPFPIYGMAAVLLGIVLIGAVVWWIVT